VGNLKEILHIYTRVSTRVQDVDGTSLDTQKELGITKSEELGLKYKVWNEGGASSHHEDLHNRPILTQLMREVEDGKVSNLFVFNNDRLSRNDITQQTIKIALQRNNVILFTKDGKFDLSNPSDKLFKTLLDGIAEYDNALRTERSRLGKISKIKQGFWYGAPPPFGYAIKEKKLVPDPLESKWVKEIFKMTKSGKSIMEIKRRLDTNGVQPRRKLGSFSTGSISRLMKNTHYIGYYNFVDKKSGEDIKCHCTSILDERLYNDVHKLLVKRNDRKQQTIRTTTNFYLLRDFMVCDHCETKISGRIVLKKNENLYFCPNKSRSWKQGNITPENKYKRGKVGGHGCDMKKSLSIPLTDHFVWTKVLEVIAKSSLLKEEVKNKVLDSKLDSSSETNEIIKKELSKRKHLLKQIDNIQISIAEMETKYLLKKYDESIYKRIEKNLNEELNKLNEEIEQSRLKVKELGNQKKWIDWLSSYNDKIDEYEKYNPEQQKEFLDGIIDKILVRYDEKTNHHHLKISFIMPLVDDGIKYKSKDTKGGYDLIDGQNSTDISISKEKTWGIEKKLTPQPNYSTVTDFAKLRG